MIEVSQSIAAGVSRVFRMLTKSAAFLAGEGPAEATAAGVALGAAGPPGVKVLAVGLKTKAGAAALNFVVVAGALGLDAAAVAVAS